MLTFVLMLVIMAVATDTRAVGQAAALAIGGRSRREPGRRADQRRIDEPCRPIGPAIVSGDLADLWIYIAAPIVGAVAAVLLYGRLRLSPATKPPGDPEPKPA